MFALVAKTVDIFPSYKKDNLQDKRLLTFFSLRRIRFLLFEQILCNMLSPQHLFPVLLPTPKSLFVYDLFIFVLSSKEYLCATI